MHMYFAQDPCIGFNFEGGVMELFFSLVLKHISEKHYFIAFAGCDGEE